MKFIPCASVSSKSSAATRSKSSPPDRYSITRISSLGVSKAETKAVTCGLEKRSKKGGFPLVTCFDFEGKMFAVPATHHSSCETMWISSKALSFTSLFRHLLEKEIEIFLIPVSAPVYYAYLMCLAAAIVPSPSLTW